MEAVSVCAELEALCAATGPSRVLSYIGMARCELTEYGARLPASYQVLNVLSIDEGLRHLDRLLTALLQDADLAFALRLHEAREIVRDGLGTSM